jgi:hypothetical protein
MGLALDSGGIAESSPGSRSTATTPRGTAARIHPAQERVVEPCESSPACEVEKRPSRRHFRTRMPAAIQFHNPIIPYPIDMGLWDWIYGVKRSEMTPQKTECRPFEFSSYFFREAD